MKTDNQTMDRAIPVSVQRKRRMVKYGKYALIVATVLGLATWLGVLMMTSVDRKSLIMSEVDQGTIDVSITATGKVVPAFEEVIISPISAQILEVYAHSGDTVDVGTPLLRLDLQSAQIDYSKALDEREIRQQQLVQLTTNTETQLSDRRMQIEVEEMKLGSWRHNCAMSSIWTASVRAPKTVCVKQKSPCARHRCNFVNSNSNTKTNCVCAKQTSV